MLKLYTNQNTSACHRSPFMANDETEMLVSDILDCLEGNALVEKVSETIIWEMIEDWAAASCDRIGFAVHKPSLRLYLDDLRYGNQAPLDAALVCVLYVQWRQHYVGNVLQYGEECSPRYQGIIRGELPGEEVYMAASPTLIESTWTPDWSEFKALSQKSIALADAIEQDLTNPGVTVDHYEHLLNQAQEAFQEWMYYAVYLGSVTLNADAVAVACNTLLLTPEIRPTELMMLVAFFRYRDTLMIAEGMEPPEQTHQRRQKRDYRLQQRWLLSNAHP